MHREKLDPGQGMLFVFEKEAVYPFWMKNMTFAIDILWIDANKKIVHVASRIPPCREDPCPVYSPHVEARYVLEIPAGDAQKQGLVVGRGARF